MNNNGEPKVPMMVAPPATSATIAPAIDSPAADVPVVNVLTPAEIYAKQLELNAKRLGFNAKQLDLDDKQLELDEQQRKLDDEQRELNGQSSVSVVFELMASASARTPAIPVVDAPNKSISPCPPIAAMPRLLVAALPAARPIAAQEGKRPVPINELTESPIAPKRHRGDGQISNAGSTTGSSPTTCRSLSEKVAVERLIAALNIPALVAPAADATTFANAPATGALAGDISALVAPAAGATMFGNAPAVGVQDLNISAFAPAAGAFAGDYSAFAAGTTTFGNAPAIGVSAVDFSALVAPAAGVPALVAPTVGFSAVDMHVSDSVTTAELLRIIYDVSGMVFDISGEQVTSERLLVALGEAPFVGLGYVQDVYSHIYGCELMPSTTLPQERIATLASVVALEHWAPQLDEEDPAAVANLNILRRRDLERTELRQSYLEQLGLAEDQSATVLGPRLCYVVVRMCAMSVDLLTGPVLRSMFLDATGLDLHSLNVVTEKGVRRIKAKKLCRLVTKWVLRLCKFITEDFSMDDARSAARLCNAAYATKCGSASSSNTSVALGMLRSNEHNSKLFLGNQAADLEEPSKRLFFVASGNTSPLVKVGLEQLAMSLQIEPSS